jgi:ABC-type sugar transport system permease subunit
MDALKHIGFDTIIILSALQDIPRPLYESAKIDGASNRQIIYRVVLPLLKPTLLYLTIMLSIWTIQVFEPIFVMTKGEPFNATRTMVYNIFDMAFYAMRLGYASAISFILFAIVLAISYAQIKAGRTRWEY